MSDDIIERLQRIEDKLDELIDLLTESSSGLEEESLYCPRCGMLLEGDNEFTHLCEA